MQFAWEDVKDLVPSRAPIGQFLTKINDRQFPELLQFCLSKCGEVTLDKLHFKSPRNVNSLQTVNPEFNEIKISYFDNYVHGFLQVLQRNLLLTNVNIDLSEFYMPQFRSQKMANLLPLVTSINQINLFEVGITLFLQRTFYKKMLTSARILCLCYHSRNDWIRNWLYLPREDGKPRILLLQDDMWEQTFDPFIEDVKTDFSMANQVVNFYICFESWYKPCHIEECSLKNKKNQGKIIIQKGARPFADFTLSTGNQL